MLITHTKNYQVNKLEGNIHITVFGIFLTLRQFLQNFYPFYFQNQVFELWKLEKLCEKMMRKGVMKTKTEDLSGIITNRL
jgi:hypothetical protein